MSAAKPDVRAPAPDPDPDDEEDWGELAQRSPLFDHGPPRYAVPEDALIERPELGENVRTFVGAGDLVPLGLEGHVIRTAATGKVLRPPRVRRGPSE